MYSRFVLTGFTHPENVTERRIMQRMSRPTLNEVFDLRDIGRDVFETVHNPMVLGDHTVVAYGGCALGAALVAAGRTVKPGYRSCSLLGNYL